MLEKTKAALALLLDVMQARREQGFDTKDDAVDAALAEIEALEKQRAALKVGDVVRTRAGGPQMVVILVEKDSARCAWWAGEGAGVPEIRDRLLPAAALERVEDEAAEQRARAEIEQKLIRAHGVLVDVNAAEGRQDVDRAALLESGGIIPRDIEKALARDSVKVGAPKGHERAALRRATGGRP